MSVLAVLQNLGIAFEATYGTAVAPVAFIPGLSLKGEDNVTKVQDTGRRGTIAKVYGSYDANYSSSFDTEFDAYPDLLGYAFKGILGAGTVTPSGANFTHVFKQVDAQSPSLTLQHYNGYNTRTYAGMVQSECNIKFDSENALTISIKYEGQKSVVSAQNYTPLFGGTKGPFMGWNANLKVDTVSSTNFVGGEISIKRDIQLLHTAGQQSPSKYNAGLLEISGKLTFDVESDAEYLWYGDEQFRALTLTFTKDADTSLVFQFSKADITKANLDTSQEYLRVDMDFTAIWNATDAGLGVITLQNQTATY